MADPVRIETRKIEHTTYGPTSIPIWAVTFAVLSNGYDALATIHVLGFSDRDVAGVDAEARKELHRISSLVAATDAGAAPAPSEPKPSESERERRWQQNRPRGSDWAV